MPAGKLRVMKRLRLASIITSGIASAWLLVPAAAEAHFILTSPAPWNNMSDNLGDPQKSAPCGQADPGNTPVPSGMVTNYHPGDTITINITETITHPGHYRVALASSQAELPADPPVTAGTSACGTTTVQTNPTLPILADGMLDHTAAFSGPQSFNVTLPAGFTCTKCTLQVIEFMSNHGLNNPGGCFYHHCADISVQAAGGTGVGGASGGDAGTGNGSGTDGGANLTKASGCSYAGSAREPSLWGLLATALAVAIARRRRASMRSVATKAAIASASNTQ